MRAITETVGPGAATGAAHPSSLQAARDRAKARRRRTDCLARAHACHAMAVQARDAEDARFLHAMTLVWQILADKGAGARGGAGR